MTTPTRHNITLPGPNVTASVSWDDVRAYLEAHGWVRSPAAEFYVATTGTSVFVRDDGSAEAMRSVIHTIAHLVEGRAPGAMLARIAGYAEAEAKRTADERAALRRRIGHHVEFPGYAGGAIVTWADVRSALPSFGWTPTKFPEYWITPRGVSNHVGGGDDMARMIELIAKVANMAPADALRRIVNRVSGEAGAARVAAAESRIAGQAEPSAADAQPMAAAQYIAYDAGAKPTPALACGCVRPSFCVLCAASEVLL